MRNTVNAGRGISDNGFGLATVDVGGDVSVAVQTADRLVLLAQLLSERDVPVTIRGLLDEWGQWCAAIEEALATRAVAAVTDAELRFLAPILDPSAIYCAGANYHDHVSEMGRDLTGETVPFHFLVPPSTLTGHGQDVIGPADEAAKLDWEVELVAVIGRRTDRATPAEARQAIAGYTVANDVSLRDWGPTGRHPFFGHRWLERKGRATFLPMGPAVVPAHFIADAGRLELGLSVNGEDRQRSNTSEMIFTLEQQVVHLSGIAPLLPGDLILTGTPAGTAAARGPYLADGDRMVAWVERVGQLANTVKR